MIEICFSVQGVPAPKPRMTQRDKRRRGQEPRPCVARYWAWVETVQWAYKAVKDRPMEPHTGPVRLGVGFYLPVPKSWSEERQAAAISGRGVHIGKPDWKNLYAGVEDALNGLAYVDDCQIIGTMASFKRYGAEPGAVIGVQLIDPGEAARRLLPESATKD